MKKNKINQFVLGTQLSCSCYFICLFDWLVGCGVTVEIVLVENWTGGFKSVAAIKQSV